MHRLMITGVILMCATLASGDERLQGWPSRAPSVTQPGGYVLVTPDGPRDGGDFGPRTKGTKTSGIQEALDYAKAHRKDSSSPAAPVA